MSIFCILLISAWDTLAKKNRSNRNSSKFETMHTIFWMLRKKPKYFTIVNRVRRFHRGVFISNIHRFRWILLFFWKSHRNIKTEEIP